MLYESYRHRTESESYNNIRSSKHFITAS